MQVFLEGKHIFLKNVMAEVLFATQNCFECTTRNGNKCATFSGHLKVVF